MEEIEEIKSQIRAKRKKVRVAINGFGRIGKMIFLASLQNSQIEIVAINDFYPISPQLLRYDSVRGEFPLHFKVEKNILYIGAKKIFLLQESEPSKLPWERLKIDVVAECTGKFTTTKDASLHIRCGAKKVLISAPSKGECFFYVRGVNDSEYIGQKIVSNGSCTTNSCCSVISELHKKYKIRQGMFSTVHSFTGDQKLVDGAHKDLRRARSGAFNIIPTTTGAAKSVTLLIPELLGKLHGIAYRVPTITGSVTDLNVELEKKVTKEELNEFLKNLCEGKLRGIMEYTTDPIVSSDIIGNSHSGIIDGLSTEKLKKGNLAKIVVWYDNEWGFSKRMIEVIVKMGTYPN